MSRFTIFIFSQILYRVITSRKIRTVGCDRHGKYDNQLWFENTEVIQLLGDKDVDGRILLKSILNKQDMWEF